MENQKTGYIPLYRSILKQSWAKDVYLRTLWENLLLNAARKPYKANFKGHEWHLQPGQLVVTAADLGLQLCDRHGKPASRDQVERMLQVFVKEGMISIDGEKQKGRVITITNYHEYAQKMDNLPAHEAAQTTAHDAAHDTSVISKQNLLLEFCADPKSRDEMQAYIDVSSRSHFSKYYLKPLLSSGKLEMMFPDKPKSKNQKYTTVHSK